MVALFIATITVATTVGVSTGLAIILAISRDLRQDRKTLQGQYARCTEINGPTLWRLTEQQHGLQERERRVVSLGVGGVGLFAELDPGASHWVAQGVQDLLPALAIINLLAHAPLVWNIGTEVSRFRQFLIEPAPHRNQIIPKTRDRRPGCNSRWGVVEKVGETAAVSFAHTCNTGPRRRAVRSQTPVV